MTCDTCGKSKKGQILDYGDGITIFRCNKCYEKDKTLRNFQECEVYSRVVGYLRPVKEWNKGKRQEYKDRKVYDNP